MDHARTAIEERAFQGSSAGADISRALVGLMSHYTGRGPTKARTTVSPNFALVVLEDTLTKAERHLVAAGDAASVRRQRETLHTLMREEAVAAVEQATGRRVRSSLRDIAPEDGIAIELFIFAPLHEADSADVVGIDAGQR